MRSPYGEEKEFFKYSLFIVFCNRLLTCSVCMLIILVRQEDIRPVAPLYKYAGVSLSNVLATSCQYEALKFVSFPVQTLAKCAKMIPVMLWGTVILRKKYGFHDYLVALVVTAGCTIFFLTGITLPQRSIEPTSETRQYHQQHQGKRLSVRLALLNLVSIFFFGPQMR
jgi:adenosine 3'-phospho 5'-phosphosulfate transporter B2